MSIVSTAVEIGSADARGRHNVIERHTDHLGIVHQVVYLAPAGADTAAIAATRAVQIAEDLAAAEASALIEAD
jgi:hypothetical protein